MKTTVSIILIFFVFACTSQKTLVNQRLVKCHSKAAKAKKAYYAQIQYR